jgi:hypothetical protein
MGLFKKKKEEDFENEFEDELDGEDEKRSLRKKKFKDLHPENKKKRKEPPKPWGRKERILVLLVLLTTAGVSAFLLISSSGFSIKVPKTPDFKSLNMPEIKFEKTIILENDLK